MHATAAVQHSYSYSYREPHAAAAGELPPPLLFADPELDDEPEDEDGVAEDDDEPADEEEDDDELSVEPPLELPLVLELDDDRLSVR